MTKSTRCSAPSHSTLQSGWSLITGVQSLASLTLVWNGSSPVYALQDLAARRERESVTQDPPNSFIYPLGANELRLSIRLIPLLSAPAVAMRGLFRDCSLFLAVLPVIAPDYIQTCLCRVNSRHNVRPGDARVYSKGVWFEAGGRIMIFILMNRWTISRIGFSPGKLRAVLEVCDFGKFEDSEWVGTLEALCYS